MRVPGVRFRKDAITDLSEHSSSLRNRFLPRRINFCHAAFLHSPDCSGADPCPRLWRRPDYFHDHHSSSADHAPCPAAAIAADEFRLRPRIARRSGIGARRQRSALRPGTGRQDSHHSQQCRRCHSFPRHYAQGSEWRRTRSAGPDLSSRLRIQPQVLRELHAPVGIALADRHCGVPGFIHQCGRCRSCQRASCWS